MLKGSHEKEYAAFKQSLIKARKDCGLSQLQLAERLGMGISQSDISKIERGERRLDVVEFVVYTRALGITAQKVLKEYEKSLEALDIQSQYAILIPSEHGYLRLLAAGKTEKEIAEHLGMNDDELRVHTKQILRKLSARTPSQALAIALQKSEPPIQLEDGDTLMTAEKVFAQIDAIAESVQKGKKKFPSPTRRRKKAVKRTADRLPENHQKE